MTHQDVAAFYAALTYGDKGRFLAFLSLQLGGTPHTWQQRLLRWLRNEDTFRPIPPIIDNALSSIIRTERWRYIEESLSDEQTNLRSRRST